MKVNTPPGGRLNLSGDSLPNKSQTLKLGHRYSVRIEEIAFRGEGIARVQGKVVFVPFSLADEDLLIEITEEKKDFAWGKILEIIKASPHRVDPKCNHFGRCGGCHLQHFHYDEQIRIKEEWAQEFINPLQKETISWEPMEKSNPPWEYRQKMRFHRGKNQEWGLYKNRSHQVVDLRECPISPSLMMEVFSKVKPLLSQAVDEFELTYDEIHQKIMMGLPGKHGIKDLNKIEGLSEIYNLNGVNASKFIERKVLDFTLKSSPSSFFQNHLQLNNRLVSEVCRWVSEDNPSSQDLVLWDLFSGIGNFSIPLASFVKKVICVEEDPLSCESLIQNAKSHELSNIFCENGAVEKVWEYLIKQSPAPDWIVLDPPRKGIKNFVKPFAQFLKTQNPRCKILWVSCDLPCLKRDLKVILDCGYQIKKAKPFDLFPQTYHLETLLYLG